MWPLLFLLLTSCFNADHRASGRPLIKSPGQAADNPTVEPTPVSDNTATGETRPSGAIFIEKDFCSCANNKRDSLNNCDNFCADKSDAQATLYLNTRMGPEVALHPDLGNLQRWCSIEINDGLKAPSCQIEAFDGTGTVLLDAVITPNSNTLKSNVNSLAINKTYVMTIVETGSGSNARSKSFQLRRIPQKIDEKFFGPLKSSPIHQYICLNRKGSTDSSTNPPTDSFTSAVKIHFFYPEANKPPARPPGDNFLICHDFRRFGSTDRALFPRLELRENVFSLWNETDLRFFDQFDQNLASATNSVLDINDIITFRLSSEYNITQTVNVFTAFSWFGHPSDDGQSNTPVKLGYIMQPFVDQDKNEAFCPTQVQYLGPSPLFRILSELVGVDTEGLYLGVREPEVFVDKDGKKEPAPTDYILIRETLLKKIWFYFEDDKFVTPDDETSVTKTVYIFWPPNTDTPHTQRASQKVYQITHPSRINNLGNANSGIRTDIIPPDKRFACIPKKSS